MLRILESTAGHISQRHLSLNAIAVVLLKTLVAIFPFLLFGHCFRGCDILHMTAVVVMALVDNRILISRNRRPPHEHTH